jgi:hypothetical protein
MEDNRYGTVAVIRRTLGMEAHLLAFARNQPALNIAE